MNRCVGITGCNGFLGGSLSCLLEKDKYNIIKISTRPENNAVIKMEHGVPIKCQPVNTVIHCGGLVGGTYNLEEYEYANVLCLKNLINWCELNGVDQIIYFSTGGVYGSNKNWVDETQPLNPQDNYSISKMKAENVILESNLKYKTILRLYFPIGDFSKNHFFSRLNNTIIKQESIFLNDKNGHPFISPISISDLYNILKKIVFHEIDGIYNLSSNYSIGIKKIIDIIAEFYNIDVEYSVLNKTVNNYLGDPNKIMSILGYTIFERPEDVIQRYLERAVNLK